MRSAGQGRTCTDSVLSEAMQRLLGRAFFWYRQGPTEQGVSFIFGSLVHRERVSVFVGECHGVGFSYVSLPFYSPDESELLLSNSAPYTAALHP